ncbi:hypothetical protein EG329_007637 [Mollisiaceae sp. DMI_Dod_QoI]|nr:hypothetical protein EG329_007637 [Helotiales sp. DMI_Dod_QoI]
MPSYAVTGASRGIGFGFIQALALKKENVVFAIIRNAATAAQLYELAKTHSNVHIVIGDATKPEDMARAASEVGAITGGKLDVLINNVGGGVAEDAKAPEDLISNPTEFKNALISSLDLNLFSGFYAMNSFLPLIRAGSVKKIIFISTGMADEYLTLKSEIPFAALYGASKSALNMMVAKCAVQFKAEGIMFLSLSPGWVATQSGKFPPSAFSYLGIAKSLVVLVDESKVDEKEMLENGANDGIAQEEEMNVKMFLPAFNKVYPDLKEKTTVEDSIRMQLETIANLTLERSGEFVSHHGDKNWV